MKINEVVVPSQVPDELDVRVISQIRQECAPYLNQIGGLRNALIVYPLWRGVPEFDWKNKRLPIMTIAVDQNRFPRDTSLRIHNLLDEWFNEKTGVKYRSQSVFVSGSKGMAIKYATNFGANIEGSSVIVLPVGNFDYCWSPRIDDLYKYIDQKLFGVTEPIIPEKIKELLEGKYYNNEQLKAAIVSGHEIMIHCKKFIIMADYYVDYLLDNYK